MMYVAESKTFKSFAGLNQIKLACLTISVEESRFIFVFLFQLKPNILI